MNGLAQRTTRVVDGLEQEAFNIVAYMYDLGIREVIPFSLAQKIIYI